MARYECDYCGAPVDIRQGKQTGLAYYNCPSCGFRTNCRPGSRMFDELVKAGLVKAPSAPSGGA